MSSNFLLIYFVVLITTLLGIIGFIMLIYGLVNKQKKLTVSGSILSFLALLVILFGVLWGVRKFVRFSIDFKKEMHFKNQNLFPSRCIPMGCHKIFMDSLCKSEDSGRVCIEKRILMGDPIKACNPNMKCNPAKCKQMCPHHKKEN